MIKKVTLRIYQVDMALPEELIAGYDSDLQDVIPEIYRCVWESKEKTSNIEALFWKYNADDRPNSFVCRSLSVTDIIEIEDESVSTFYICDNFGFTEIEFDKSKVTPELGFSNRYWYVNSDSERRKTLAMEIAEKGVTQIIAQRLGKSPKTASAMFRKSLVYENLYNEKTGLWKESPYIIAEKLEKELSELKN